VTVLVHEAIGRQLTDLGVRTVFGVVGSGNFHFTDAMVRGGARFVAARHEGGAATMADAYARMSDEVAVVSLHQGCGYTNALTGITEAAKSRTPLLVLTAEAADPTSNFALDQAAIAVGVGAVALRVRSPATALDDVARAFAICRHQRRTVVLNVPIDVQDAPLEAAPPARQYRRVAEPRPDDTETAAFARLLERAERPVFVVGRGGRSPGAGDAVRELAAETGALLATSAVARGMFNGDAWNIDVSGGFSSPLTAELVSGADLLVGFGCALNMWTMRHGRLIAPDATVVQVDLEPGAIGLGHDRVAAGELARRAHRVPHSGRGRADPVRPALEPARIRGRLGGRTDRPSQPDRRAQRHPAHRADRLRGLGQLPRLPEHVPRRSRRVRVLLHPGVPVRRPRPGDRDRRGAGAAGPAAGGRLR
jgi:acetolactate synthase-1/2/3 large subunit